MVMAGTLTLEKRCVRSETFPYDGKLVNNPLSMGPERGKAVLTDRNVIKTFI